MSSPEHTPRIRAIVVTHNNARDIRACLESLKASGGDITTVVVDNASTDATLDIVKESCEGISLIANRRNVGFARAVNAAAKDDRDGFDYLLLVNPDVILSPSTVSALTSLAIMRPDAGLYGGRMMAADGRLDPTSCLAAPSLWQAVAFGLGLSLAKGAPFLDPDSLVNWRRTGVREVPVLTAGLLLIGADCWAALGGFKEGYVLYGEDVDFSVRAWRLGFRPTFTDAATYTHIGGGSSASKADRMCLILRGKATLYRDHLAGPSRALAARSLVLGVALRALLEAAFRPSEDQWRYAWRARAAWRGGWP